MKLRELLFGAAGLFVLTATAGAADPATTRQAPPSRDDAGNQATADAVAGAIARALPGRGYRVNVQVDGPMVKLRGMASTPEQIRRMMETAQAAAPGRRVANLMSLMPAPAVQTTAYVAQVPGDPEPALLPEPTPVPETLTPSVPQPSHRAMAPQYDWPFMPPFSWPAYAPYPNYSAVQYPRHYRANEWPYIGPFHPYPEPPLDWREVKLSTWAGLNIFAKGDMTPPDWHCISLKWDDGHWYLRFRDPWWTRLTTHVRKTAYDDSCCPADCLKCGWNVCFRPAWHTHQYLR